MSTNTGKAEAEDGFEYEDEYAGDNNDNDESGDVAVIGMAGRFPGASSVEEFWENLLQGRESVSVLTEQLDTAEPGHVPAYGVLAGADEFDAEFFGYSPEEALVIDPQQRVLLECAHEALERAGHGGPERLVTGVFVGGSATDHAARLRAQLSDLPFLTESQIRLGTDLDYLSSRVAYKLGLSGPALTVLTACSSSLVAVHVAIQSLLSGDCAMALAGGASVLASIPRLRHDPGGIFSRDGHCRPFDAAGDGTVAASAVGLVVLRPLADARAHGDHIHAVIRGTAVNNDGRDKIGFTAPSVSGQAEAIRAAHLVAGIDAEDIGYVEAHGTATAFGDPIEIAALTQAFRRTTGRSGYCRIGSVKSNIGHADAAAGAAGLIKAVLSVEHAVLPASLHFTRPNPDIDFGTSPFEVNTRTGPWKTDGRPRIAAANAIGIGGTNAHALIAEAPPPPTTTPGRPHQLLVVSARTENALANAARQLAEHLDEHPEQELADVAWTLQTGRTHHAERRFVVAANRAEAVVALRDGGHGTAWFSRTTERRSVAFMFADYAEQRAFDAEELRATEPVFRDAMDEVAECAGLARLPSTLQAGALGYHDVFALQYAMARLLASWGLRPDAVAGLGVGAYTAATLAGVFSLHDAVRLVAGRERLLLDAARPGPPSGTALRDWARTIASLPTGEPELPLVSDTTGTWVESHALRSVDYWVEHARRPARPGEVLSTLAADPERVLVDIGPGRASAPSVRHQHPLVVSALPGPDDPVPATRAALTAAGRLWAAGASLDFAALHTGERRRLTRVPTYPFERRSYPVTDFPGSASSTGSAAS